MGCVPLRLCEEWPNALARLLLYIAELKLLCSPVWFPVDAAPRLLSITGWLTRLEYLGLEPVAKFSIHLSIYSLRRISIYPYTLHGPRAWSHGRCWGTCILVYACLCGPDTCHGPGPRPKVPVRYIEKWRYKYTYIRCLMTWSVPGDLIIPTSSNIFECLNTSSQVITKSYNIVPNLTKSYKIEHIRPNQRKP